MKLLKPKELKILSSICFIYREEVEREREAQYWARERQPEQSPVVKEKVPSWETPQKDFTQVIMKGLKNLEDWGTKQYNNHEKLINFGEVCSDWKEWLSNLCVVVRRKRNCDVEDVLQCVREKGAGWREKKKRKKK